MKIVVGVVLYRNSIDEVAFFMKSLEVAEGYLRKRFPNLEVGVYFWNNGESGSEFFSTLRVRTTLAFEWQKSEENIGFGRANNRLMQRAFDENDAVAYIAANPDGFFHYRCLSELYELSLKRDHGAMIEARQQPCELAKYYDLETLETGWCSGACLWIPPVVFGETNGFDENIFLYSEDVDLSWRARLAGIKTLFCPTAWFYHSANEHVDLLNREKELLLSGRYVAYRWGDVKQARMYEKQLLKKELIRDKSELSAKPKPLFEAGANPLVEHQDRW